MRVRLLLPGMMCALLTLILCLESNAPGQQPGRPKWDPEKLFKQMANGRDFFLIEDMRFDREALEFYAKQQGVTDGKIKQDLYLKFFEKREDIRKEFVAAGGKLPEKGKGGGGGGAEQMFRQYDKNRDGKLSEEEISTTTTLKTEWKKWDENKDLHIDLDEYKKFIEARFPSSTTTAKKDEGKTEKKDATKTEKKADSTSAKTTESKPVSPGTIVVDDVDSSLPVVIRHPNGLPKDLPDWFVKYDVSPKDAQVSLMEWLKAGKTPRDFAKYDTNDDGYITPEEVLRLNGRPAASAQTAKAAPEPESPKKRKKKG